MIAVKDRTSGADLGGATRSTRTIKTHPQIPPVAQFLGSLGVIPFIFLVLAGPYLEASFQERTHIALAAYGSRILSPLGEIHWGPEIAGANLSQIIGSTFV
mgnify:CR=1 FL=1